MTTQAHPVVGTPCMSAFSETTDLSSCEGPSGLQSLKYLLPSLLRKVGQFCSKYFSLSFSKPSCPLQSEDYLGEWLPLGSAVCRKSHSGSGGLCGQEPSSSEQGLLLKIACRLHLHPPPSAATPATWKEQHLRVPSTPFPWGCCFTDLDQNEK